MIGHGRGAAAKAEKSCSAIAIFPSTVSAGFGFGGKFGQGIIMVKDRTDTSEYLLRKGERLNLTADSTLVFLVGNAAGINFTVNGKNEGVLGQEYQVISYLKITKDGIVSKRLKEIIKENAAIDSNSVN